MDPKLASAIMPVYHGEEFLAQAIDSILAQTYRLIASERIYSSADSESGIIKQGHDVAKRPERCSQS